MKPRRNACEGPSGSSIIVAPLSAAPVLMITAFSTVGSAVEAMKAGALDYIAKPFDMDELTVTVARARAWPISRTLSAGSLPENGCNIEEVERELVRQALERTNGNQTRAARLLGVTRDQIRYRIEKFGFRTEQE